MKANEFFKAMGLKAVKQFLENDNIRTKEMSDELKRIVESHELVDAIGGLVFAKKFIETTGSTMERTLENAIADVESCQ